MNESKLVKFIKKTFSAFGALGYLIMSIPTRDCTGIKYSEKFYLSKKNTQERQRYNECSAYSTAFVLRHYGNEINGLQAYDKMKFKIPFSGYVLPKSIVQCMKSYDFKCKIFKGNMESLKTRLAEGKPVIVEIGQGFKWQHYMTLVGYDNDKKEMYFFDSSKEPCESPNHSGNRTMSEEEFLKVWDNGLPWFNHMYIAII